MSGARTLVRWCVLADDGRAGPLRVLNAVGNGHEFQYPIFPTRAEARAWVQREATWKTIVVRCVVSFRVDTR